MTNPLTTRERRALTALAVLGERFTTELAHLERDLGDDVERMILIKRIALMRHDLMNALTRVQAELLGIESPE